MGQKLNLSGYTPYRIRILAGNIAKTFESNYLVAFNLGILEWRVLSWVAQVPGLSVKGIAERTTMQKMAVSRSVSRLVNSRYMTRHTNSKDGRVSNLQLTKQGLAIYQVIEPIAIKFEERLLADVGPKERETLNKALDSMFNALSALNENPELFE